MQVLNDGDRAFFLSLTLNCGFLCTDSLPHHGFTSGGKDGLGPSLVRERDGGMSLLYRQSGNSMQQGRVVLQREGHWEPKKPCNLKPITLSARRFSRLCNGINSNVAGLTYKNQLNFYTLAVNNPKRKLGKRFRL